jgi:hypothetical protein
MDYGLWSSSVPAKRKTPAKKRYAVIRFMFAIMVPVGAQQVMRAIAVMC